MWIVHRILRAGYASAAMTGFFSTPVGRSLYENLYERFKLAMEGQVVNELSKRIAKDSLVIDVGANIGIYANIFRQGLGKDGRIAAIEADPQNASSLRRRFANEPRIDVIEAAASSAAGFCRLEQDRFNPAGHALGENGIEVKCIAIDDIVDDYALPVSLIKIDVEGAEPLVLSGARKTISKHHPALYVEYSPERIAKQGGNPKLMLSELEGFGYQHYVGDWTHPVSIDEIEQKASAKGYVDVLLIAR